MQPGVARVRDLAMQSCYPRTHLPAAVAAAFAASERALPAAQFILGPLRDARVRDHHIVAAIGEYLQAEINPERRRNGAFLWCFYRYLQANVPAATIAAKYA